MLMKEPIQAGKLLLPNRLVMPPMATEKSSDGKVTDALCAYYRDRAEGAAIGLIITEHCYISKDGKASPGQLSVGEDCDMEGLKKLVEEKII